MFKRKILSDVSINFLSSILVLVSLQILLYPKISKISNADFFGSFVFLMSIFNFISSVIGGTGNSIFMKKYSEYKKEKKVLTGYREVISLIYLFFLLSLIPLLIYFTKLGYSLFDQLIFVILVILITYRIYLISWFRVDLRYIEIFKANLVLSLSYLLIFIFLSDVSMIFLFIAIAELTFTIVAIGIDKKPVILLPKLSGSIRTIYKGFLILLVSTLLVSALKYLDRWFINTFMDTKLLAYFYVASITGSIFSIPFNTLSNVAFSYFIQSNKVTKKTLKYLITILPLLPIGLIVIGGVIGPIIISMLYPEYYEESLELFYILNIGYGFLIIDYLLRGFIVKFFAEKHKLFIDAISIAFCLIFLLLLTPIYSLKGVAFAFTLTFILKSLIDYVYLFIYTRRIK